jgi:tRNA-2-methylthio-N6-dimethylallyladenosine synthase
MNAATATPGQLIPPQEILREPADLAVAPATGRSAYIETYGCQMNVADTELVATILGDAGYRMCERPEQADVILINTCAVREHAEERVIGRASQLSGLRAQRAGLTLGILGCMAQHLSKSLPRRAPFVDLVVGPDSYQRLPEILAQTSDETLLDVRLSRSENYAGLDPTRSSGTNAWVTIIRGCDKFCTFCIVPYVRGRERSLEAAEVLRQVRRIAAEGFRQVTLLGQTVNSYLDDSGVDFADLLRSVAVVEGIERIRFTSPYPVDFDDRTIEAMATVPEICPSLHLPVQTASDRLLGLMKRGYTISQYRDLVGRLREAVPGLALTTDVIVGFCSETDGEFEQTYDLMKEIRYDSAFMFKYSERPGTAAHRGIPDDVQEQVKAERLQEVIRLQERISGEINEAAVGRTVEVLVEGPSRRSAKSGTPSNYGRSPQGKTVVFPEAAEPNSLIEVRVDRVTSHTLYGTRIET